jgi:hypothetical protein
MNSEDQAKASKIIERWFQGTITNDEFDDEWPWNSSDPAIREIGRELWSYFDDDPTNTLTETQIDVLIRSLDFLNTALAYHYEIYPQPRTLWGKLKGPFVSQQTRLTTEQEKHWPFSSISERDQHWQLATHSRE